MPTIPTQRITDPVTTFGPALWVQPDKEDTVPVPETQLDEFVGEIWGNGVCQALRDINLTYSGQRGIIGPWIVGAVTYPAVDGTAGQVLTTDGAGNATFQSSGVPALSNASPQPLGPAAPGTSAQASRADHVHAHGNLGGGSLHDLTSTAAVGFYPRSNFAAATAPTVNDDSGDGYSRGSRWVVVTNGHEYVCVDDAVGAAVWRQTSGIESLGPVTVDRLVTTSSTTGRNLQQTTITVAGSAMSGVGALSCTSVAASGSVAGASCRGSQFVEMGGQSSIAAPVAGDGRLGARSSDSRPLWRTSTATNVVAYTDIFRELFSFAVVTVTVSGTISNWDPGGAAWPGASHVRATGAPGATVNITGLVAAPNDGYTVVLTNALTDGSDVLLTIEASASTAANRFAGPSNSWQLMAGQSVLLVYDSTSSRWRVIGANRFP
jgi:hypothetical protein